MVNPVQKVVLVSDGVVSVTPDGKVLPELFPSNALSLFEENLKDLVAQAVISGDVKVVAANTGVGFVQRLEAGGSEIVAKRGAMSVVRTGIDKLVIEKAQAITDNIWSFKTAREIEGYVIAGARMSNMPEKVYRVRIKSTHEIEVIDEDGATVAREKVSVSTPVEQAMKSSSFKARIGEIAEKSMAVAMALWGLMTLAEATNSHVRPSVADVERLMVEAGMTCAMAVPMIVGGGIAGGFALVGCLGTALSIGIDLYKMFQFDEPAFLLTMPWDVGAIERKLEAFARGGTSFLYRTIDYMRGIAYPEGFAKVGAMAFGGRDVVSALTVPSVAPRLSLPLLSHPLLDTLRLNYQTMSVAPRVNQRAAERLANVLGLTSATSLPTLLAPKPHVPMEGTLLSLSNHLTRDVLADLVALAMKGPEAASIVDRLYQRLAVKSFIEKPDIVQTPLSAPKPSSVPKQSAPTNLPLHPSSPPPAPSVPTPLRVNQQTVGANGTNDHSLPTGPVPLSPSLYALLPVLTSGTFVALSKTRNVEREISDLKARIENVEQMTRKMKVSAPAITREVVRAELKEVADEVPDCCDTPFNAERYPISPKLKTKLGLPKWALPEIHLPSLPMAAGLTGVGFVVSLIAQLLADIEYPP